MQGNGTSRDPLAGLPDGALWRRSRLIDLPEDEAARFLDLASFTDGVLDADESERVADWLAGDPNAAADVAAARALSRATALDGPSEAVIARVCALVSAAEAAPAGMIIPFRPRRTARVELRGMARWGSLVAAAMVAGWLGFTLGMDTSRSLAPVAEPGMTETVLHEMLDPSSVLLRGLPTDTQT